MSIIGRKRSHSSSSESPTRPCKRRCTGTSSAILGHGPSTTTKKKSVAPNSTKKSVAPAEADGSLAPAVLKEHVASTYRTPKNPQATFSNLPVELRLQIYAHLHEATIIHVHHHEEKGGSRFTWTPCRSPSSVSPLLCANPKWSGMCAEEDRCTYKIYAPPEPIGFWALAASNKSIRAEAQEFFMRKTVVSIHPRALRPWLDHLAKHDSKTIENLRRITLAGPNSYLALTPAELQLVRDRIPNLEAVGLQCQDSIWRWRGFRNNAVPVDGTAWRSWQVIDWMRIFDSSVTIALEAMVWLKAHPRWRPGVTEQQTAIRIIREGKPAEMRSGTNTIWSDDDVEMSIHKPGMLGAPKRNAKWRQWWRVKETKGMA